MSAFELDHVAFAVPGWMQAGTAAAAKFNARWVSGFHQVVFSPCQLELADGMRLELLEPGTAGSGFINDYLQSNAGRPKAHHITFKVADIHLALETARAAGVRTILENTSNPWWREAFLHPKDTGLGFLVQLVETSLTLDGEDQITADDQVPCPWQQPGCAMEDSAGPPARLDAICGQVRDSEAAIRVLCTVLGGNLQRIGDGNRQLAFSWPEGSTLILETADAIPGLQALVFSAPQDPAPPLDSGLLQDVRRNARTFEPLGIGLLEYQHQPAS